jgi:hypothetical protein
VSRYFPSVAVCICVREGLGDKRVALLTVCKGTVLTSGILQICKIQNPEGLRILALLSDLWNSTFKCLYRPFKILGLFYLSFLFVAVQIYVGAPWQIKWQHLSWPIRVLKHGNLHTWKECENPEIFRISLLFQIFENPLLSTLIGHAKCLNIFGPASVFC